jgi:hypothetical protein
MRGRKTATLNLRVAPEIKAAAEKAAADDNRSLTSLVETLLLPYLRDRGYLPKPDAPGGGNPGPTTRSKLGPSRVPRPKKPTERRAEPAAPLSKEAQIRALREQGAR